jgi:hypothetical protein
MKSTSFKGNTSSHSVFNMLTTLLHELLELGCSIPEIARQTQISPRTLGRLYRGEISQPTQNTFSRVLSFYCHHTTNSMKS